MSLLTQLFDVTPLCVENNTIFTQMLENKRPFVVAVVVGGVVEVVLLFLLLLL